MPNLAELVRKLIFVISCLVNEDLPQLHEVMTENGQLNYNALQDVHAILTQRRRNDILEMLHETMAGKIIVKPKNYLDLPQIQFSDIFHFPRNQL
jgi:hypothetical protein